MTDKQSPKAPRMRQARKSIAHMPSSDLGGNKENATLDAAALTSLTAKGKQAAKKSRSKSVGPGGLDALKESTGNKGGVCQSLNLTRPFHADCLEACACSDEVNSEANDISIALETYPQSRKVGQCFSEQEWKTKDVGKFTQEVTQIAFFKR